MFHNCPYGGMCIDPDIPSDCEINSRCVNFSSTEEKLAFDTLPDLYEVKSGSLTVKFKNKTQLQFFLTDYKGEVAVSLITEDDRRIPLSVVDLFRSCN